MSPWMLDFLVTQLMMIMESDDGGQRSNRDYWGGAQY